MNLNLKDLGIQLALDLLAEKRKELWSKLEANEDPTIRRDYLVALAYCSQLSDMLAPRGEQPQKSWDLGKTENDNGYILR